MPAGDTAPESGTRSGHKRPSSQDVNGSAPGNSLRETKRRKLDDHTSFIGTDASSLEMVVPYDTAVDLPPTALYTRLASISGSDAYSKYFGDARRVQKELGPSASDLVWRHWLNKNYNDETRSDMNLAASTMRGIIESWSFDMPRAFSTFSPSNVTPQFTKLVQILQSCEPHGARFRGIVFVKKPVIATMLVDLLQFVDETMDTIRPRVVPCKANDEVHAVVNQFADGVCNLLVVSETSDCIQVVQPSVAIRWNRCKLSNRRMTWRELPGKRVHIIHMVKSSQQNSAESSGGPIVSSRLSPSSYIDQSTSQNGSNSPSGYFFDVNPDTGRHIKDPMTGRRIEPSDSVEVLQRFLADLSRETNPATLTQSPKVEKLLNDQYVCKVDFPVELSLPSVFGPSRPSRAQAEEDACFQACQRLFDLGLLNSRFFPDNHSTPALTSIFADAPIATGGSLNRYHKIRPGFWNNTIDMDAHRLYPTVVEIENQPTGASYARMLILTRSPLPQLGKISLFPFNARVIASMHHGAAFQVNDEKLHTLYRYTLRLSRALTNKPLEGTLKQMPYLFAPLDSTAAEKDSVLYNKPYTSVVDLIHWESVKLGAEVITLPLIVPDASIEETCRDVVLQDRCTELSRRFDLVRIRHDLTPHSKAEDSPREAGYSSFLEYCKSRRRDFGELRNNDQPMLEVTPIPPLLDYTSPAPRTVQQPPKASLKYLIPELCCKITIPASVFRTAQMLPSILHRIDDMLVTKQLNEVLFDGSIDEHLLLSALTPVAARAEHDYERLELLGDAFLKYMSSTFCYTALPEKGEGGLHSLRNTIVSNKALVSGAQSIGLPGYIRGRPFVPGIWSPFLARGSDEGSSTLASSPKRGKRTRQQEDQYTQTIADKAIADVVEAIIGAAYISTDKEGALRAAKTLGVALPQVEAWSDFKALSTTTAGSPHHLSTEQLHAVEHIVGFKFKRSELLAEALTHSSMHAQSKTVNYDRLEFLGDAILDLYVVQDLFDRYPHLSSGGLSMLRSAMVVNTTLATICVLSGIYKFISYASTDLKNKVEEFAVRIKALYHLELQQSKAESRPLGQFWVNVVAPKSLSDVVEAILGALFVSEDFSDIGASTFFKKQILPFLEQHVRIQTLSHHPSKTLYEMFHAEKCEEHQMVKASENGLTKCSVIVHNVVLAEDVDPSPSIAVRKAASAALRALEGDAGFMTRVCDCRLSRALKKGQKSKAGVNLGYDLDEDTLKCESS